LSQKDWEPFKTELFELSDFVVLECEMIKDEEVYAHVVVDHELATDVNGLIVQHKAELVELPIAKGSVSDELERLDDRLQKIVQRENQLKEAATILAKDLPKLRMVYDAVNWKRQRKEVRKDFLATESSVVISGWIPKKVIPKIREDLTGISKHFELLEVESGEGEVPPVLMENNSFMRPFRAVTDVYGLPKYNELDPTPFLAVFFIVYFGMCLTDAGYGILMFAITWAALKYLDIPKGMRNMVRLLMYGGILTFIMGILFGGWFGLTVDQAPAWLTTVKPDGSLKFIGQTFDALGNAMQILIISLVLGFAQVLFGVWINFIHKLRTTSRAEAWFDAFPWTFIITAIGFLLLVATGVLPESLMMPAKYLLYASIAFIVLTQGRDKSNIIVKFLSGVLGLYDLVGYMSDVLSYSRLLALGLATAIIGMAVNIIAGLAGGIPYIGIVLAIIVLVVGHVFNLGINALGSFIHSGRLQFVEFFGKFLEGGGAAFKPFARDSRFVNISSKQ
jgi:V/A-type H+/Na+-transporting ATPase subunit I